MFIEKAGCRWIVAAMIFANTCINYMMRVNVSVNIVAMVATSNETYDGSRVSLDWTPYQKAQILSSYFWGYLASNVSSGLLTERCGPHVIAFTMVVISAILTILSPAAAKHSYAMMLIVRIFIGFCSGFLMPAMFALIGNWAVPNERGKFLGCVIGGTIGTFITWTMCGVIIEAFGWEWGFYTFGIIALLWCIPWWFLIYDTPDKHPRISAEELEYVKEGIKVTTKLKQFPPYWKIMTSLSVWSFLIANFGSGWGIYFVITAAPSYLSSALSYKISSTGALSGLIYLCRSTASFGFGSAGDYLLKRKTFSVPALRRLAAVGSHIVPGCLLLGLTVAGFPTIVYVVLITTAMTVNGLITLSCVANSYDLTSNFVGSLSSLMVAGTTLAGIISPLVTAYFTKYNEIYPEAWRPVFYTGSLVYIVSGLQFIVFCSTQKQAWDVVEAGKQIDQCEKLNV